MTTPKRLRERAINVRLNAYYKTGGVGMDMLRAERLANALEAQAADIERDAAGTLKVDGDPSK